MPTDQTPPDFGPSTEQLDTAQNRDALPPGTLLGGHQIVDVLAVDDYGIVYLALDPSLQRQVAIKEYLPTMLARRRADNQVSLRAGEYGAAFNEGMKAFLQESETLSRLNHPSLLDITRTWEANATAYRMMPFYSGQRLSEVLPTLGQPPDEPWLRRMLTDLLGALQSLHTASWLHLNVSPRSIILQSDGRPVLLGLGSVRRAIESKKPVSIRLDPPAFDYAAPEVADARNVRANVGPWTDLFSLAAVFHHAIVGRPPMPVVQRLRGDRMQPLATTVLTLAVNYPGLVYSLELTGALTKALSMTPSDRPQGVAAFLNALDTPSSRAGASTGAFPFASQDRGFESVSPRFESSSVEPVPQKRSALRWAIPVVLLGALGAGAWQWQQSGGFPTSRSAAPVPQVQPVSPPTAVVQEAEPVAPVAEVEPAAPTVVPTQPPVSPEPTPQQVAATPPAPTVAPVAAKPAPERNAAPAQRTTSPERAPERPAPRNASAAPAATAEPDNPRAVCGPRTNFSLTYCMETQCKRPRFQRHPQCLAMRLER